MYDVPVRYPDCLLHCLDNKLQAQTFQLLSLVQLNNRRSTSQSLEDVSVYIFVWGIHPIVPKFGFTKSIKT